MGEEETYRKSGKIIGEMRNVFKNITTRTSYDLRLATFHSTHTDARNWNKNYNNLFLKKKKKRSFFSSTIKSNRGKQEEEARSLKRRKRKRLMNEMKSVRTKTKGEPLL